MNAKVYISIVAGAVLLTASMAPADSYFIRNRPFTQVIKVGSEPYVPLDGLLRALGYNWDVQDGTWSVVVMNADGSAGVDAGVSAGAKVDWLGTLGWSLLGAGILLGAGATTLIVLGARRR